MTRPRSLTMILCGALGCGTPAMTSNDDLAAPAGDMASTVHVDMVAVASSDQATPSSDQATASSDQATPSSDQATPSSDGAAPAMTFFISSRMGSANLGGLAGADKICQDLATAAGAGQRTWAAYLSVSTPMNVSASTRIGPGPWHNAKGVLIAASVADLHSIANNINKATGLDEQGVQVPGRSDNPNHHDILTGSHPDGRPTTVDCAAWTSDTTGNATVGHFDREGGGNDPMSWNSAHVSQACSAQSLINTGGAGRIYCFAKN